MSTDANAIWTAAWKGLGATPPDDSYSELVAGYADLGRAYHTLQHINECFQHFEPARDVAERAEEVELAIWFHDAVYDTKSKDSEERSARFAQRCLLDGGVAAESIDRVHNLILGTKHLNPPVGADEALLVDTDLSILGARTDRFDEYEVQVRHEYSWVPLDTYKLERSRILQRFLDRPRVYWSKHFFDTLENRARANLARSIERLLA